MTCSWNFISLYTHDTIFNPGRFNGFVSKKEDDAADLVSRAEFIYQNIPAWRIPKALLPKLKNNRMTKQPPMLEFEDIHSKIQGFPQGSGQLRQYTLSGILGDECAFWEEAQKFYSASKPTLDGGGRMTLISSRSPGFFKKIVFDQLNAKDLTFPEVAPAQVRTPLEGIEMWRNPSNKFIIVDLHYTANPAKRGRKWREAVKQSMPIRDFQMEYEKSWQTYEGKPVYEDYVPALHKSKYTIDPEPGIPLLIGWDFGLTPAAVICQLVGRHLRILKELLEDDGSIKKLAPRVINELAVNFPNWARRLTESVYLYVDPAGFKRSEADEKTCVQTMKEVGFKGCKFHPGAIDWESRRQSVEDFLIYHDKQGPGLLVSERECPIIVEGFGGGYHYSENVVEIQTNKVRPEKNKFSHPHDALQMVTSVIGARMKIKRKINPEPLPHYGFQK